jgi:hypothetical protein
MAERQATRACECTGASGRGHSRGPWVVEDVEIIGSWPRVPPVDAGLAEAAGVEGLESPEED